MFPPEVSAASGAILAAVAVGLVLTVFFGWALPRTLRLPGWTFSSVAWVAVLAYALSLFGSTRPVSDWLLLHVLWPILILAALLVVSSLLARWMRRAIELYFDQLERVRYPSGSEGVARFKARTFMVRQAVVLIAQAALYTTGALVFLGTLQVNISALLTGAGIFGVALGIAAQDILKDIAAGFYIVVEDQFGVDDLISTQGVEGWVEGFTLRATRVRDAEGASTTIPNSMVRIVKNLSRRGFHADVKIAVPARYDVKKSLAAMREIGETLAREWPDRVAGGPRWVGVEELADEKVTLRMIVPTSSAESQLAVRRELLLRLQEEMGRLATSKAPG